MPSTDPSRRRFTQAAACGLVTFPAVVLAQPAGFWTLLREGGCVLLMRHAQTDPGVGDPPNFEIGNCSTQRNLSAAGREQARRVGAAFVRERVKVDQVRSSAWCRCVDTAMLAFKQNTVWPPINSFFGSDTRDVQTRAVLDAVQGWQAPRNLVLVTHQVNITALTGQGLSMGEILLTRPAREGSGTQLRVLARQTF
ncbi:MAG: histidine phosphatase family protein [Hydrogenophaga sp.]|jgi:broad specificity phosphatase PhoE|uniref:histidine phosphatase family protein n=1 Tax=Hydrogenophaga sp. TaxID=1904254 RepID=UPI002634B03A|nr:histidine phosphatase family protein [Hydrogenophaga sp.]MCV0437114.1 histidine phosphatase family protein [Hydrogenophaga sp.]